MKKNFGDSFEVKRPAKRFLRFSTSNRKIKQWEPAQENFISPDAVFRP
jgi:hypothetical protein